LFIALSKGAEFYRQTVRQAIPEWPIKKLGDAMEFLRRVRQMLVLTGVALFSTLSVDNFVDELRSTLSRRLQRYVSVNLVIF